MEKEAWWPVLKPIHENFFTKTNNFGNIKPKLYLEVYQNLIII